MNRPPDLRDRTAARIIDAAARVFAERGEAASMAEVAAAAGVGRATLYRYFPNRDALVGGLVAASIEELRARIDDAGLESVGVREALARVCRGFTAAGVRYAFLARVGDKTDEQEAEINRLLGRPIRDLLERGAAEGVLRDDVAPGVLFALFTGLLQQALHLVAAGELGAEPAASAVVAVFLDGAGADGERKQG